ncbi:MAG: hypothetical protein ABIK09_03025 [Pseudomonadota bacterium]
MERIRQGSGRLAARVFLLVTLLLAVAVTGCRKEIPEEKARAIFTEIAADLVKRSDATDAAKTGLVDAVCEKNGFVRKDLEYLLKTQPEAKAWLEEALKAEIEREVEEERQQWEKRVTKARQNNEKNANDLETDQAAKFEKIEQETARRRAEIDEQFKARQEKLQARAEALQKDIEK